MFLSSKTEIAAKSLCQILRSTTWVEAHLLEPIMVKHMADAANLSLFHFSRVFNSVTRHSPYDYLIRRRLTEAAKQLCQGNNPITDIALEFSFGTPEGFSRAFRRMFGVLPSHARKNRYIDDRRYLSRVSREYLEAIHNAGFYRPIPKHIECISFSGTADRIPCFRKTTPRIPPHPSCDTIIIDYTPDWSKRGVQVLAANSRNGDLPASANQLSTTAAAGIYVCFTGILIEDMLTHFSTYLFGTFIPHCQGAKLPDRIIFRKDTQSTWNALAMLQD